jgi:hypothetical protein
MRTRVLFSILIGGLISTAVSSQQLEIPVTNWTVPPYRGTSGAITTMTDITDGSVFVAVTPCRLVDTRNPAGPYGGPALTANTTRNFDLNSGPCLGIPALLAAYSLSIGAIVPPSDGFLTAWPAGTVQPVVSQLNFKGGEVTATAAIVPASANGTISVFVNVGTHIYIDMNGYFMDNGTFNSALNLSWHGNTSDAFMFVENLNTTSSSSSAIFGRMNTLQNNVSAIRGEMAGTTGANRAVSGINKSSTGNSAGVFGESETAPNITVSLTGAGVRGQGDRTFGVIGVSELVGVAGYVMSPTTGQATAAGFLGSTIGTDPSGGGAPWAVFGAGIIGATGNKYFLDPHPSDPMKAIGYISLEGPEAGTYFRGRGRFQNGIARIPVPEHFRMVSDAEGLTVQITPIGAMATVAIMKMDLDEIVVQASRNVEFCYLVQGVRSTQRDSQPILSGGIFVPESAETRMPEYLSEEQKLRLVQNGTYNENGTVNMETARRLGWNERWAERERRPSPEPTPE